MFFEAASKAFSFRRCRPIEDVRTFLYIRKPIATTHKKSSTNRWTIYSTNHWVDHCINKSLRFWEKKCQHLMNDLFNESWSWSMHQRIIEVLRKKVPTFENIQQPCTKKVPTFDKHSITMHKKSSNIRQTFDNHRKNTWQNYPKPSQNHPKMPKTIAKPSKNTQNHPKTIQKTTQKHPKKYIMNMKGIEPSTNRLKV